MKLFSKLAIKKKLKVHGECRFGNDLYNVELNSNAGLVFTKHSSGIIKASNGNTNTGTITITVTNSNVKSDSVVLLTVGTITDNVGSVFPATISVGNIDDNTFIITIYNVATPGYVTFNPFNINYLIC